VTRFEGFNLRLEESSAEPEVPDEVEEFVATAFVGIMEGEVVEVSFRSYGKLGFAQ
jgi:hypothetical protein